MLISGKSMLITLCITLFSVAAIAQDSKKTVILIEGEPTEVDLSAFGDILKVYRQIPGYMAGFYPYAGQARTEETPVYPNNRLIDEVKAEREGASFYNVFFNENSDELDDAALEKLDKTIAAFERRVSSFLLITANYKKGDNQSRDLAEARVAAIQAYLQKADITNSKMVISVTERMATSNNLQVQIK